MRQPTSGPERAALLVINTLKYQPQGSKRRHQAFVTSLATNNHEMQGRQPASAILAEYQLRTPHHETVLPLFTSRLGTSPWTQSHAKREEELPCRQQNAKERNIHGSPRHAVALSPLHAPRAASRVTKPSTVTRESQRKPKS